MRGDELGMASQEQHHGWANRGTVQKPARGGLMRKTCLDMVCRLAEEDERIIFIGSDLGYGTMARFKAKMPDRFFMEGVSEANVVGMAAGLALEGKIVYVNTIATFITRRCFEQIVLGGCLHT